MAEPIDITSAASVAATADRWVRYAAERDPAIREQLILQYAPLVKYVVGRLAIMLPRILDSDDVLSIGTTGPSAALEEGELLEGLAAAVDALNDRERTLLSLYYEQELTMKEISAVLEVSESRVCQLHARALHRLRAHMGTLVEAA